MSSVLVNGGLVHYEAHGRGAPVILLHGWLGSWRIWVPTMEALSRRYRTYALDLWGFGDSAKMPDRYSVPDFVDLVDGFMEKMGLDSAPVIGHSMGGTVAMKLAAERPSRVERLIPVSGLLIGRSLNPILQLTANRLVAYLVWNSPTLLRIGIRLVSRRIASSWHVWYREILDDLSKTTMEAFTLSVRSLCHTDLRPVIKGVSHQTLVIFGRHDNIVAPNQAEMIARHISGSQLLIFPGARHFPMLDEPEQFNRAVLRFLTEGSLGPARPL